MSDWQQIEINSNPEVVIKLTMLLDNSASMASDWTKTKEGVTEYFNGLKESPSVRYLATLRCFADRTSSVFEESELADIKDGFIEDTRANGTSTALYDALGTELNKIKDSTIPNLVVVFTDGQDNSSKEWNATKIRDLRKQLENKGNFTFVFMGANPDVWQEQKTVAPSANSAVFDRSRIKTEVSRLRRATMSYAQTMVVNSQADMGINTMSVSNFYQDVGDEDLTTTK